MPPKKTTASSTAAPKKAKAPSAHPPYKEMIREAILSLKERTGSSRQAIKKYITANHNIDETRFNGQFNLAISRGVEAGDWTQPKGSSGPLKLAKKEKKETATKPAADGAAAPAKPKKAVAPKAKPAAKAKAAAPKTKKAAAKPKAAAAKAAGTPKKGKAAAAKPKKAAAKPKAAAKAK